MVAIIFSSLAFLSSSISMANLSRLVATIFSSLALLSSSISTANLSTNFSSLSFLSNSLSLHRFNLLRVARRCFSWSSVSDDLLQCCQLSGVSFRTEMSSFPDFQLHFRIFFVRCLALSFDIPAAVGSCSSKSEGKASRGGSTRPSLFWCPYTEFSITT